MRQAAIDVVWRFLSEVIIHLSFHHLLNGAAEQVFESILDVFGSLDTCIFPDSCGFIRFC